MSTPRATTTSAAPSGAGAGGFARRPFRRASPVQVRTSANRSPRVIGAGRFSRPATHPPARSRGPPLAVDEVSCLPGLLSVTAPLTRSRARLRGAASPPLTGSHRSPPAPGSAFRLSLRLSPDRAGVPAVGQVATRPELPAGSTKEVTP